MRLASAAAEAPLASAAALRRTAPRAGTPVDRGNRTEARISIPLHAGAPQPAGFRAAARPRNGLGRARSRAGRVVVGVPRHYPTGAATRQGARPYL